MKMLNVNISQSAVEIIRETYTGNDGLYSAVVPTEKSATKILDLCDSLGLQVNPDDLHVTVMYSETGTSDVPKIENVKFNAGGYEVKHWTGHDNKTYVVLGLVSDDLHEEHQRLTQLGAKHSYDEYQPHCSLYCTEQSLSKKLLRGIESVNATLAGKPMNLFFEKQFFANLKD